MALSVPLSRFTSRVGGGSAFYVRPQLYVRFGVTHITMKKIAALLIVASSLFFAGCCTSHHATAWEYKTIVGTVYSNVVPPPPLLAAQLNQAAADGWQVVSSGTEDGHTYVILRRHK